MNRTQTVRWMVLIAAAFCLLASSAYGQQSAKKEHIFRGKVEKVDAQAKKPTVNGENTPGWMGAMVMAHSVDTADILKTLKVGDQITAKVYDGDLVLHDVKVVPAKAGGEAPKK